MKKIQICKKNFKILFAGEIDKSENWRFMEV